MSTIDNTRVKPHSEELRSALSEYRDRNQLTLSDLAKELNTSPTAISKYLNGKPEGDVEKLESLIQDVLKNEKHRQRAANENFDTPVSRKMNGILRQAMATNDFTLIFGPAGVGKTCGIQLFCAEVPTCIAITASRWSNKPSDVEGMLFNTVSNREWKQNTKRADFLVFKLAGSNRLIIVDNAHKLTRTAIDWLFDFADATNCPVALIGNPEVLDTIRLNDQHFSRIGCVASLEVKPGKASDVALKIVEQLAPEAASEVLGAVTAIAEKHGHFRAVRKEITLAKNIKGDSQLPWLTAIKAAHTQLIRNYEI
jgi:DNA transposition AAA+ family ATPase